MKVSTIGTTWNRTGTALESHWNRIGTTQEPRPGERFAETKQQFAVLADNRNRMEPHWNRASGERFAETKQAFAQK